jgi:hypothetical protein
MNPIEELPDDIKQALCTISVKFRGEKRNFAIGDELRIDYEHIEHEMEELPNKFHLWAMLYSEVREQKEVVEKKVRKRKGILYDEIRKQLGDERLRRSDIDDIMEVDEMLETLEAQQIILEKQCQKLWFVLESLRMKNDNIRSLSGFRKQELYQANQSV